MYAKCCYIKVAFRVARAPLTTVAWLASLTCPVDFRRLGRFFDDLLALHYREKKNERTNSIRRNSTSNHLLGIMQQSLPEVKTAAATFSLNLLTPS